MKTFDYDEYCRICSYERKRIAKLDYNSQYQQQFSYCGKTYLYDPDFDCFYAVHEFEQSHLGRWGWIYFTVILGVIAFFMTK